MPLGIKARRLQKNLGAILFFPDRFQGDLDELREIIDSGAVRSVIDRSYSLDDISEAHAYVEQYHKKGNSSWRSNIDESRTFTKYGGPQHFKLQDIWSQVGVKFTPLVLTRPIGVRNSPYVGPWSV